MLRAYALKYRWRHPGPEQWLGVVEDHFEPLTVSWVKRTLFDRAWVDWRVALTSNATKARVTSRGGLKLPVAVLLTDHNNRSVTQTVSPDSDGVEVGFVDGRPIRSAEVDPSHVWLIERNRSNNAVRHSAETVSPRTLLFGQLLTQWLYGALGP